MATTKPLRRRGTRLKVKTKARPELRPKMVKGVKIPSPGGPIPIPYPNVPQKKS